MGLNYLISGLIVSVTLLGSPEASAQRTGVEPDVHIIWMGGSDCPPCVAWRRDELPKLMASTEFQRVKFTYVTKTIKSAVPSRFFLPDEVKPYKDKLDVASSGTTGSPQAAIMVNGEVYDYFQRVRTAKEFESMLGSIRNGGEYPFKRCIKVSTQRGQCDIEG